MPGLPIRFRYLENNRCHRVQIEIPKATKGVYHA